MNATLPSLAPDAAIALGIAATALPFARTPQDEAERWLRVLRLHGDSGAALQALGVSEGPLSEPRGSRRPEAAAGESAVGAGAGPGGVRPRDTPDAGDRDADRDDADRDVVADVVAQAAEIAGRRGAGDVGTRDLLAAVIEVYGEHFDRLLRAHGTDSREVLQRIAAGAH
ncbi:MAG TPA: hypothetical protein VMU32_00525 [Solirubrobacteraceae bacterium]|nr:hypothetical protein [Solirubrobacteraceae bacterium]